MLRTLAAFGAALGAALAGVTVQAPDAASAKISGPAQISLIDTGALKGEPTRLAWSPDGTHLYLETSERDHTMNLKTPRAFVMTAAEGNPSRVPAAPDWAAEYWRWKSAQSAPGRDELAIDISKDEKQTTATSSPMGGSLAGDNMTAGRGATTVDDVTNRTQQMHKQQVITLTLLGETVGEFVDTAFVPGYTFGWSPHSLGMIAYTTTQGQLAIMDANGHKQRVDGTRGVLLPAWAADGSKIAFLEKVGKNRYSLNFVTVSADRERKGPAPTGAAARN